MKFYCPDCETYFDDPVSETTWSHSKYIGYGGMYPDTVCRCPECGSEDFEECEDVCELCDERVYKTRTVGHFEVCPECFDKLKDIMGKAADEITGEFPLIDRLDAERLISEFYEED